MTRDLAILGFGAALIVGVAGPAAAERQVLATGTVIKGSTVYNAAVVTYDEALDATDAGSNPGLELWPNAAAAAAGTGRLSRSNDNNGQWDYAPAGAFFANNTVFVYGTRTGSHGPQGRVWTYTGGSFLVQQSSAFSCGADVDGVRRFGDFEGITKGSASYTAYVEYNQAEDDTDVGNPPGLRVKQDSTNTVLWRANDNNGQWDYRIDCAYAFGGTIYIVGARSSNNGGTFTPRVWDTTSNGGFLIQSSGF